LSGIRKVRHFYEDPSPFSLLPSSDSRKGNTASLAPPCEAFAEFLEWDRWLGSFTVLPPASPSWDFFFFTPTFFFLFALFPMSRWRSGFQMSPPLLLCLSPLLALDSPPRLPSFKIVVSIFFSFFLRGPVLFARLQGKCKSLCSFKVPPQNGGVCPPPPFNSDQLSVFLLTSPFPRLRGVFQPFFFPGRV